MGLIKHESSIEKLRKEYLMYAKVYKERTGYSTKQFNECTKAILGLHNTNNPQPQDWVNAAIEVFDIISKQDPEDLGGDIVDCGPMGNDFY